MVTISACLIVKNEASNLAACLQSIQGFVDQIVIVDTGSTDDTLAIAANFTDFVFEHPWADDFSAPRNVALEQATGDRVLHVDADERWTAQGISQRFEKLATVDADAPQVRFCSYVQQQERVLKRTLHRHHRGLYFQGRVHEYLSAHQPLLHIDCPEIEVMHQPRNDSEFQKQRYYAQLIGLELQGTVSLARKMVLHWHHYLALKVQAKPYFFALKKACQAPPNTVSRKQSHPDLFKTQAFVGICGTDPSNYGDAPGAIACYQQGGFPIYNQQSVGNGDSFKVYSYCAFGGDSGCTVDCDGGGDSGGGGNSGGGQEDEYFDLFVTTAERPNDPIPGDSDTQISISPKDQNGKYDSLTIGVKDVGNVGWTLTVKAGGETVLSETGSGSRNDITVDMSLFAENKTGSIKLVSSGERRVYVKDLRIDNDPQRGINHWQSSKTKRRRRWF